MTEPEKPPPLGTKERAEFYALKRRSVYRVLLKLVRAHKEAVEAWEREEQRRRTR